MLKWLVENWALVALAITIAALLAGGLFGRYYDRAVELATGWCRELAGACSRGAGRLFGWAKQGLGLLMQFNRWLIDKLPNLSKEQEAPERDQDDLGASPLKRRHMNATIVAFGVIALAAFIALNGYLLYDITPDLFALSPKDMASGSGRWISLLVPIAILLGEVVGGIFVKHEQWRRAQEIAAVEARIDAIREAGGQVVAGQDAILRRKHRTQAMLGTAWSIFLFCYLVEVAAGFRRSFSYLEVDVHTSQVSLDPDSVGAALLFGALAAGVPWAIFGLSKVVEPMITEYDLISWLFRGGARVFGFVIVATILFSVGALPGSFLLILGAAILGLIGLLLVGVAFGIPHVLQPIITRGVLGLFLFVPHRIIEAARGAWADYQKARAEARERKRAGEAEEAQRRADAERSGLTAQDRDHGTTAGRPRAVRAAPPRAVRAGLRRDPPELDDSGILMDRAQTDLNSPWDRSPTRKGAAAEQPADERATVIALNIGDPEEQATGRGGPDDRNDDDDDTDVGGKGGKGQSGVGNGGSILRSFVTAFVLVGVAQWGGSGCIVQSGTPQEARDRTFPTIYASELKETPSTDVFGDVATVNLGKYLREHHEVVQVVEPKVHLCLADLTASVRSYGIREAILLKCAELVSATNAAQGPETTGIVLPIVASGLASDAPLVRFEGARVPARCVVNPAIPEFLSRSTVADSKMKKAQKAYGKETEQCGKAVATARRDALGAREQARARFAEDVRSKLIDRSYQRTDLFGALRLARELIRQEEQNIGGRIGVTVSVISDLEDDANGCTYDGTTVQCLGQLEDAVSTFCRGTAGTRCQVYQVRESTSADRRGAQFTAEKQRRDARQDAWGQYWQEVTGTAPLTFTAPQLADLPPEPKRDDPSPRDEHSERCARVSIIKGRYADMVRRSLRPDEWIVYGEALAACPPATKPWDAVGAASRERYREDYVLRYLNGDVARGEAFQKQKPTEHRSLVDTWAGGG